MWCRYPSYSRWEGRRSDALDNALARAHDPHLPLRLLRTGAPNVTNMTEVVRPEYLSLIGLLNTRLFTIPGYQRPYSWETRERKDLFDDIEDVWREGEDHFHGHCGLPRAGRQRHTAH